MNDYARRCNSDEEKATGDPAKDSPATDNDDCKPHFSTEEYSFTGQSVPSAGWRAVYAAMEVDVR